MRTKSLTSEQMEARVARFNKLQTYQRQNFETYNIPLGAVEKVTARRVYPVMAVRPEGANHQWRKNPHGELSIDPVADERLVRVTARVGAS